MDRIRSFREVLIERFGRPLQRIPIDLALSCPHRAAGKGGCIFCPEDGARARHLRHVLDLPAQVNAGIHFVRERYGAEPPYIAYFQSYTNTYGDLTLLRRLYEEVLALADFAAVIVATRPDCLGEPVLNWLNELNTRYDVWVELGVQTVHDSTLERINRGHDWACSEDAIRRLNAHGLQTAVHLIAGLPGETLDDMKVTAQTIAKLPVQGVKFHQMMILNHTPLAKLWGEDPSLFAVRNEYDYAAALGKMLRELPETFCVMRLSADAPPDRLIAPKWWMSKSQFRAFFESAFAEKSEQESGRLVRTQDGSLTAYHPGYRQHFHSIAGAESETDFRFITPSALPERLKDGNVSLLDIGFGLGYNALSAIRCAENAASGYLTILSLENDPRVLPLALAIRKDLPERFQVERLIDSGRWQGQFSSIELHLGDGRRLIPDDSSFDLVFLDPFSPDVNPELWSYDFIRLLVTRLKPGGMILTYSTAFPVIGAFLRSGLTLAQTAPFGGKRGGIAAVKGSCPSLLQPLRAKDEAIARRTLAGVVYRDSALSASPEALRIRRERTVSRLRIRGIPKWLSLS